MLHGVLQVILFSTKDICRRVGVAHRLLDRFCNCLLEGKVEIRTPPYHLANHSSLEARTNTSHVERAHARLWSRLPFRLGLDSYPLHKSEGFPCTPRLGQASSQANGLPRKTVLGVVDPPPRTLGCPRSICWRRRDLFGGQWSLGCTSIAHFLPAFICADRIVTMDCRCHLFH